MGDHIFKTQRSSPSRKRHAGQCMGLCFPRGGPSGTGTAFPLSGSQPHRKAPWDKFLCHMCSQLAQGNSIYKYEPFFFYQQGAKSLQPPQLLTLTIWSLLDNP